MTIMDVKAFFGGEAGNHPFTPLSLPKERPKSHSEHIVIHIRKGIFSKYCRSLSYSQCKIA